MAKRLLHEAASLRGEPAYACDSLFPSEEDIFSWTAVLRGPDSSPYAHGRWVVDIEVPKDYPVKPPKLKFRTRICHPNISWTTGEVCLDILKSRWTPAWTLASVLTAVQTMLNSPEPDSPLNVDAANLLRAGEIEGYNSLVRFYTTKYAVAPK